MIKWKAKKIITLSLIAILTLTGASKTAAQSAAQIQQNINSHNDKIRQLEAEIKEYEKQIQAVGNEAKTLESAIKVLDINQKKITAEVQKTETNIQKTNATILSLGGEIGNAEKKIATNKEAIAEALSSIRERDEASLIETFLSNKSISELFDEYEAATQFQEKVRVQSQELAVHKNELTDKKTSTEAEKSKLLSLKSELADQNKMLDLNKKEKNDLLSVTKNKETEYKKILADRQAEKERFERELFEFESQLKRAIDPGSYPTGRSGIFSWPLDSVYITQMFGKTADSGRLYSSGTHNGVDFRASRGTPVKSVLNGVVEGVGNTDEQRGCYSYGKWILVKHPNGLSTLYAHLDLIKVSAGQNVTTGEIIGYSGNTGYSTGPHLHLTVYASQGVEIQRYSSSINCKNVTIPIADVKAYLDPMLYLPS